MHLPTLLLALPLSFLLSTALARPVLHPSALDIEGSWRLPPSFLFPPPPLNSTHSQEKSKRNVIKNPKVVLNPKNPAFESSARSLAAARSTSTAATSTSARHTSSVLAGSRTPSYYDAPTATTSAEMTATPTRTREPTTSSRLSSSATLQPTSSTRTESQLYTGGIATYYYQNGNAGNCGTVNPDSAMIVALPTSTYADGAHCGQTVQITRTDTGRTLLATVADSCPSCENAACLDMSVALFEAFGGTEEMGIL
ncbi:RlpA-like double-psi beta-barrel-containing protein domain-containing protein [Rhodotorula toruloides]|uniref:RlpA-like double-psi beta-barrel-containing protein domain-containing protein n=1 Tax=Rhodotorula toruloides TaxID=5286 RepID=A0A2T0A0Q2_RHOTO|nr:RlpA-like double-psi beta-barrel-containing protein domain-containing protein [Rhodotorula toruloides]